MRCLVDAEGKLYNNNMYHKSMLTAEGKLYNMYHKGMLISYKSMLTVRLRLTARNIL